MGVNFEAQNNFYEILNISSKNKQNPRKKIKFWNNVKFFEVPNFGGRKSYWFGRKTQIFFLNPELKAIQHIILGL